MAWFSRFERKEMMTRIQHVFITVSVLVMGAALVIPVQAQAPEGSRRGFRMGSRRDSLLGLLRIEQVQKELNLSEENIAKVTEISGKLGTEMREKYTALREIEDREERSAKLTELTNEFDRKTREQLLEVLSREQMMRLYQIRMQVRPIVDSLMNRYVVRQLELTEEQQKKVAEIAKNTQAKQSELFRGMRDATQEQRREVSQKLRKMRSDADENALKLLNAKQKKALEEMKGKKITLPTRRGGRQSATR
jgi:hypothetical protein